MSSEDLLNEITSRLINSFHPEKIILFGSRAKGSDDPRSDYDILVTCSITGKRRKLMIDMDRALKGLPLARDILVLTPQEFEENKIIPGTIARSAWQEGKVLYERN